MASIDDSNRLNAATFAAHATLYSGHRPGYPAELVTHLAGIAPAHDAAWDCGTGNGQLALALAAHFDHVVASDASAEQIALAAPHPRVDYRVVAAEAADLPGASVSLVAVAQAVHWFDLDRFYPRVDHALCERGVFAVIGYAGFSATPDIDAVVRRVVLDRIAPYWASGNRMVWGGYRELPFPFDEIALPGFELAVRWTLPRYLGYLASWSAWQRYVRAQGDDLTEPLRAALAPLWGDGEQRLSTPLAVRAGRKRG
jgi:hypothetical protein